MMNNTNYDSASRPIIELLNDCYPTHEPVVRYAFPREDGAPNQEPTLRSISDPIPEGANWVSALYFITDDQLARLNQHSDDPYANPAPENIAKTIQDECEDAGRVLYSVHAESDEYEGNDDPVPLTTMIGWLQRFSREVIDTDPEECPFYYSGNRSIHLHTPFFITGENLRWFKEQTKQFCSEIGAELDTTVYKRKQQFRLPGATHAKTGGALQKTRIDTDWSHDRIIRAAADEVPHPDTYADVLDTIFRPYEGKDPSDFLLTPPTVETSSPATSSFAGNRYQRPYGKDHDAAYEAPEFYPYPTGNDHDGRSVASLRVEGEPFERSEAGKPRVFVPCFFYGAHSCSGREYTKDQHYAPLQLSKKDGDKWDYARGETLVVIGGGNYKSIILTVDKPTAERVGNLLDPDDGNRIDALDYLQAEGFDIGSSGPSQSTTDPADQQSSAQSHDDAPPTTDAQRYKQRAERGDVEQSIEHGERRDIANRLLTIGDWDLAWRWFREQYGDDFDPQRTWNGLRNVIKTFPEDFEDIEVPPKP
jgi:hypothetical protein